VSQDLVRSPRSGSRSRSGARPGGPRIDRPPASGGAIPRLRITGDDLRRMLVLIVVSTLCALVVVSYSSAPKDPLQPGDVAPYTVKAPFNLSYPDENRLAAARAEAEANELPVFVHTADLVDDRAEAITLAFAGGRAALRELGWREDQPVPPLGQELALHVVQAFLSPLRVQLKETDVLTLVRAGFPTEAEQLARQLVRRAMADHLIVISRDQLPHDRGEIRVIHLAAGERSEELVADLQRILVPEEARQRVTLGLLEAERTPESEAAGEVARAMVTANLQYQALETEERRATASQAIPMEWVSVKRGQILFRGGEVLTEADLDVYRHFQEYDGDQHWWIEVLSIALFFSLLFTTLHHFVVAWLGGPQTKPRDLWTMGGLLVLVALLARMTVASSELIAALVGYDVEPTSVWFAVPLAGAAMLARVLLGASWTFGFTVAAAVVCGLVMDQQALPVAFFLITGVAGASAVEDARERITVVRAGVWVGLVGAIAVLLIHLVQLFVVDGEVLLAAPMRPFWSMVFAFGGGLAGAFLVLSLVPVLESFGYVTDYRMLELANLDHPLLRQLMLRAPGSYHHSVIVGSLSEAGAAAIGANSLLARVASYFHDVGKASQPQYFVENQQGGLNRHSHLDPFTSANVIINHVVEGGRMAREHNLPQPIIDNIFMHHGTGILQYFYESACEQAPDRAIIDEATFRYPGPKPNTREAGIIMLADKVEAATRTLRVPDEQHIRQMIGRIVSSVIADGQFSECPLTFAEIQKVTETFVGVLGGIYHQRVEYPATADVSRGPPAPALTPAERGMITVELPSPAVAAPASVQAPQGTQLPPADSEAPWHDPTEEELPPDVVDPVDYESVDYLPRRD
jgi:cyclic-di-AMP phosphodiesterase PgpH